MDIGTLTGVITLEDQMSAVLAKLDSVLKATDEHAKTASGGISQLQKSMSGSVATGVLFGNMLTQVTGYLMELPRTAYRAGQEVSGAMATIARTTGATGTELGVLQESFKTIFKDVPESAGEVSKAIADVNVRLGFTGPQLENVTRQILSFANVNNVEVAGATKTITTLMKALELNVEDVGLTMDKLTYGAQQSGISVDRLAQGVISGGIAFKEMGFGLDESIALFAQFERVGANVSDVTSSLHRTLGRLAKEGFTDAKSAFAGLLEQIEKAPTFMDASRLSIEAFGAKAGPKLTEEIRGGTYAVGEFVAKLQGVAGLTERTAQATETFDEKMAILRNQVTLILSPLGKHLVDAFTTLIPYFKTAAEKALALTNELGDLLSKVNELPEPLKSIGGAALIAAAGIWALYAAVSAVAASRFVAWIVSLKTAIPVITAGISELVAMTAAFGAEGLGVTILGWVQAIPVVGQIVAAIVALGIAIYGLVKYWDTIKKVATDTWDWIASKTTWAFKIISDAITWVSETAIGRFIVALTQLTLKIGGWAFIVVGKVLWEGLVLGIELAIAAVKMFLGWGASLWEWFGNLSYVKGFLSVLQGVAHFFEVVLVTSFKIAAAVFHAHFDPILKLIETLNKFVENPVDYTPVTGSPTPNLMTTGRESPFAPLQAGVAQSRTGAFGSATEGSWHAPATEAMKEYEKAVASLFKTFAEGDADLKKFEDAFRRLTPAMLAQVDVQKRVESGIMDLLAANKPLSVAMEQVLVNLQKNRAALLVWEVALLSAEGVTLELVDALKKAGLSEDQIALKYRVSATSLTELIRLEQQRLDTKSKFAAHDQAELAKVVQKAKQEEDIERTSADAIKKIREDNAKRLRQLDMGTYELAVENIKNYERETLITFAQGGPSEEAMKAYAAALKEALKPQLDKAEFDKALSDYYRWEEQKAKVKKEGYDLGASIADGLKSSLASLGDIFMDAFTGGGGWIGGLKALLVKAGSELGKSFSEALTSAIKDAKTDKDNGIGTGALSLTGNIAAGGLGGLAGAGAMAGGATTGQAMGAVASTAIGVGTAAYAAGGMTGAMVAGAWTMGIGAAVVAAIVIYKAKHMAEWEKLGKEIGQKFGVALDEELLRQMEKSSKKIGRQATSYLYLPEIINAAGGVTARNVDMFTRQLADMFTLLHNGTLTVDNIRVVMDKTFGAILEEQTDNVGAWSDEIKRVILLDQQLGVNSAAVAQAIQGQVNWMINSFQAIIGGTAEAAKGYSKLREEVEKAQKAFDDARKSQAVEAFVKGKGHVPGGPPTGALSSAGNLADSTLQTTLMDTSAALERALSAQAAAFAAARQELADLGTIAGATFATAVASGMSFSQALASMQPGLSALRQQYTDLGISIDELEDPFLKVLLVQSAVMERAPQLLAAADGLAGSLTSMANLNVLNVSSFEALAQQAHRTYVRLQGEVAAVGGTTRDALLPMQGYLQQAARYAKDLGIPLDENTQSMINQSIELGLWKDAGEDSATTQIRLMTSLVGAVNAVVDAIINGVIPALGRIGTTVTDAADATEDSSDRAVTALGEWEDATNKVVQMQSPTGLEGILYYSKLAGVSVVQLANLSVPAFIKMAEALGGVVKELMYSEDGVIDLGGTMSKFFTETDIEFFNLRQTAIDTMKDVKNEVINTFKTVGKETASAFKSAGRELDIVLGKMSQFSGGITLPTFETPRAPEGSTTAPTPHPYEGYVDLSQLRYMTQAEAMARATAVFRDTLGIELTAERMAVLASRFSGPLIRDRVEAFLQQVQRDTALQGLQFAGGSGGVRDFSRGTPATLHGMERVQTQDQMRSEWRELIGEQSRQQQVTVDNKIFIMVDPGTGRGKIVRESDLRGLSQALLNNGELSVPARVLTGSKK